MRFYVEGRMSVCVGIEISAKSLEEALEKTKSMKITDFITIDGDHNDSNFRVSGVFEGSGLTKP